MGKIPRRVSAARVLKRIVQAIWPPIEGCRFSLAQAMMEPLELRQMLSASPAAVRKALAKLDTNLISAFQEYQQFHAAQAATAKAGGTALPATAFTPTDALLHTVDGSVVLQAYANLGYNKSLAATLGKLHGQNIKINGRELDALLPIGQLGKLAGYTGLRFAEATAYSVNTGSVTSQGDADVLGPQARSQYNVSGSGVKVGILSDSFNNSGSLYTDHYSNDVASNDLPASPYVTVLSDNSVGTDEGRAIAQVVYDTAPGVSLDFATGGSSYQTGAANIKALAQDGAKVIVDDMTYFNEPFFQDSTMSQEVTALNSSGVTYISAAGNFGSKSFASNWSNGAVYSAGAISNASGAPYFWGGTSFNFNTTGGVNDQQSFTLGNNQSVNISLQWDQPYYSVSGGSGCQNQVDIYLLNSAGTQILWGSVNLTTGKDPIQTFTYQNKTGASANYKLMIVSEAGYASPVNYIKYIDFAGQATNWGPADNASTIFGHAQAVGDESVGAANWNYGTGAPALESYSSTGGTTAGGGTPILFNTAGGRLSSAIYRQGPAIVGPDDIATTFYGPVVNGLHSFSGTSAAAATTAGVAVLLMQKNPSLNSSQIDGLLASHALGMQTSNPAQVGAGFVQAIPAIAYTVGNITGTVFSDNNANGIQDTGAGEAGLSGVTVYIDLNNSGSFQSGDPTATTNSAGAYTFYNQPTGTNIVVRPLTPNGYAAVTTSRNITIVGNSNTSGVNFGLFPDAYTSTASGSNWILQLDAAHTSTVDVLLNNVVTYSAPLSFVLAMSFNLQGNNSSLTVNFASGDPVPSGGISESGPASNPNNISLIINGTSADDTADVSYPITTFDGSVIGVSNITSEIINGNGGNDVFSVTTAQPNTQSLTFNGGAGNDSLTVNDVLPNNGTTTTFNAGTNTLDQNTLTVNAGVWTFNGNPAAQSANLTVNLGTTAGLDVNQSAISLFGTVVFTPGSLGSGFALRNLAALNIGFGDLVTVAAPLSHADRQVLDLGSLSIAGPGMDINNNPIVGGILDLNANDMLITNQSLSSVEPYLANGFNGGTWNGTGGIQSSAAAGDTTHLTALGSMTNSASTFDGISGIPAAVLIKYTYYGDANLSGNVDGSDYSLTDNGYLSGATGWSNGDFNYDGSINGSDYTLIDNAFNQQRTALKAPLGARAVHVPLNLRLRGSRPCWTSSVERITHPQLND